MEALPPFGAPEVRRPSIASATSVIAIGRGLAYRGQGGIDVEEDGAVRRVLGDAGGFVFGSVRWAGAWIGATKDRPGVPPVTEAIVFVRDGRPPIEVAGRAFGVSGDERFAVVAGAALHRVDLEAGTVETLGPLVEVDLGEPSVAVGASGQTVLVTEGPKPALTFIDLSTGARERLVGPIDEDAWIRAAFAPDGGVVALDMRLGGSPLFRMLYLSRGLAPRELLRSRVAQPDGGVAFAGRSFAVAPLSLEAHPMADYGPVDLVAVPLSGGAQAKVTRTGDVRGTVRATREAVLVEGGEHVLWLPLG
jgi:hypothetical protein